MYHKYIEYRRHQRERVIRHREGIIQSTFTFPATAVRCRGKLSKGKVHCSCPLCAAKSKRDRGVKNRSVRNYKISDQRKFARIEAQLADIDEMEEL